MQCIHSSVICLPLLLNRDSVQLPLTVPHRLELLHMLPISDRQGRAGCSWLCCRLLSTFGCRFGNCWGRQLFGDPIFLQDAPGKTQLVHKGVAYHCHCSFHCPHTHARLSSVARQRGHAQLQWHHFAHDAPVLFRNALHNSQHRHLCRTDIAHNSVLRKCFERSEECNGSE